MSILVLVFRALSLALLLSLLPLTDGFVRQATAQTSEVTAPDFSEWTKLATRAEAATEDSRVTNLALEQLRTQLVDWREVLLGAQSTNSARIATLLTQIAALGPVPTEAGTEVSEIASRRKELNDQLAQLQAPGIAAEEAYRRADGLIRQIDQVLRDRQADELLRLWPMPVNPANWPAGFRALTATVGSLWKEMAGAWAAPERRDELKGNLPLILLYLALAVALIWRGRPLMERITLRFQESASARGAKVWALLVSLGQIALPTIGVILLVEGVLLTGMVGLVGEVVASALPGVGFMIFAANWLGGRIFPKGEGVDAPLKLLKERRAEGRFYVTTFGLLIALNSLRQAVIDPAQADEAATSVLTFPVLVIVGLLLFRVGQLLRRHVQNDTVPGEPLSTRNRLIGFFGPVAEMIGVGGPLLAAIGYVLAAEAVVYPAALSLGLMALLMILQKLVGDIYALITGNEESSRASLLPVLIGFGLVLVAIPVFALIWGARVADLTEIWTQFREGFSIGQTRISPTDFLLFIVLFAAGYTVTRLVQGALKSSVLPKTTLDQGGQNAIVAGVGYVGIFFAALIAIKSAGIDLSGLAIVAGALSVGIGFGLQNIVSNFVSGIILLIERPVSEGDWIEVGGVQGTVKSISVRSTRIQTFDRTDVIVPNADLVSGMVTNWTRFNLTGRLIVPVGVAYGSDTRKVEAILRSIAEAQPLAVLNPPPMVVLQGFGADSLNFEVRLILRDVNFSVSVRSDINHEIVRRFAEEGIEIPFAQRDVWLRNPEALLPRQAVAAQGTGPVQPPFRDEIDLDGRDNLPGDDGADGPDAGEGRS